MAGRNEENLRELLERFLERREAEQAAADIEAGERILEEYPAPAPRAGLLLEIRSEMAARLESRGSHRLRELVYRAASVAAAVLIAAAIWNGFRNGGGTNEKFTAGLVPAALWESADIANDNSRLASFTAEIEQIEEQVRALESGDYEGNGESAVTELEMELSKISADFWKG
jgi:hypothetical protein